MIINKTLRLKKDINHVGLDWIGKVNVQTKGFALVTATVLQSIVQRIATGLHPQAIILFGSYVHGPPLPDSDLDILLIMQTTQLPADHVVAISRLLGPRPFPMDDERFQ